MDLAWNRSHVFVLEGFCEPLYVQMALAITFYGVQSEQDWVTSESRAAKWK